MMGQLERRVEAISGEISSQAVANTLWAFATIGTKLGEQMMGLLEQRVESVAESFTAQEVSSTLWAFAEMDWRPYKAKEEERMMGLLEERVEATSATFNSHDVSKTLWAYATMKRRPGERMMELLEGRVKDLSGQFSPQNIATLVWAYEMMGRKLGERMMEFLLREQEDTESIKGKGTLLNGAQRDLPHDLFEHSSSRPVCELQCLESARGRGDGFETSCFVKRSVMCTRKGDYSDEQLTELRVQARTCRKHVEAVSACTSLSLFSLSFSLFLSCTSSLPPFFSHF
jgi:hypothetical protein